MKCYIDVISWSLTLLALMYTVNAFSYLNFAIQIVVLYTSIYPKSNILRISDWQPDLILNMSGGVYGGDEVGALVFDPGHFSLRVGYAGEDCPKAEIPAIVGTSPDSGDGDEMDTGEGVKTKKKYHVDTVMLNYPKKDMEVASFMKDGMVADWDMFEQVLDYSYKKIIQSPSEYHPVLFRYV